MKWNNLVTYDKGKLFWKARDDVPKQWNSRLAGKEVGSLSDGYVRFECNKKRYFAHRVIWEMHNGKIPNNKQIDHINQNKQDNNITNLQLVTATQNQQRRTDGKGSCYIKKRARPYQATKVHNKLRYNLGYFGTACGSYMAFKTFFIGRELCK